LFARVRIVLSRTTHPGNVGATARAMKTMGFSQLVLINPKDYPSGHATAMASGADDILEKTKVVDNLDDALKGCQLVCALSARSRTLPWPLVTPKIGCERIKHSLNHDGEGDIALLFGTESSGLSNQELQAANLHINIPANENYSSLNLAQAVQVLCYELRMSLIEEQLNSKVEVRENPLATYEQVNGFYEQLEETCTQLAFLNPKQPRQLMARLRRLFIRAELDVQDVNILRGFLKAVQRHL